MEFEFIPVSEKLPPYGAPVLIKTKGVVQHVTYTLDGWDDVPDWFEPYHFEHDDNMKIRWDRVDAWALMPDWKD